MSKHQIREILPPTTRNFETRTRNLDEQIGYLNSQIAYIRSKADYADVIASNSEYALFASLEALNRSDNSPCILLAGWYGADNCGDELMMQTVLEHLPESLLPNTTVLLWDNKDYSIAKIDPRVKTLHYPFTTQGIQALAELFDVVIWGGGAIIDDEQYSPSPMNHSTGNLLIRLSRRMLAQNKQVFCISLSSNGSIQNAEYIQELHTIINGAQYFSLRDPYSLETLKSAGINTARVQLDSDIVFADEHLHELAEQNRDASRSITNKPIGLVLHCFDGLGDFNYQLVQDVIALAGQTAGSKAPEVMLIPFYNEFESDTTYLNELVDRLREEHPEVVLPRVMPYEDDLSRSPLLECGIVLSCRYHASLIAGCLGIPFVAICNDLHSHYPNKTKYLLDQFFPGTDAAAKLICVSDYSKEKLAAGIEAARTAAVSAQVIEELFTTEHTRLSDALAPLARK